MVLQVPLPPALRRELAMRVGRIVPFTKATSLARQVRRQAGVRRVQVDQPRHTVACRWIEAGGSLAALQALLGHASVVTAERYARLSDDLIRREAERSYGAHHREETVKGGVNAV